MRNADALSVLARTTHMENIENTGFQAPACQGGPRVESVRTRRWQSVLPERRIDDHLHPRRVGLPHRLLAQQVTSMGIGDHQRVDARTAC